MQVTEYQENVLGRGVTWSDLVCFQKITSPTRVEDGFGDEEAVTGIWMRDDETLTKSEATARGGGMDL